MLHRLRPDRPEVSQWEAAFAAWQAARPPFPAPAKPEIVTLQDVQNAIEINDMAPAWVPRFTQIAYRPITNTDAARAHEIGVFSDDQLYHSFRDNGYNETNARTLVGFYQQLKSRRTNNAAGVWSIRKTVKAYKAGTLTRFDASQLLAPLFADPKQITAVLDGADKEVKAEILGKQLEKTRKGYFVGATTHAETREALIALGVDRQRIDDLMTVWNVERSGRYREATVRQLNKWASIGILSVEEYKNRLLNLGFTDMDSDRIIYATNFDVIQNIKANIVKQSNALVKAYKDSRFIKKASEDDMKKAIQELQAQQDKLQSELDKSGAKK